MNPKELLPDSFTGLEKDENRSSKPEPLYIPPPAKSLYKPLCIETTFSVGIHNTLAETAVNPADQFLSIALTPFSPTAIAVSPFPSSITQVTTPPITQTTMMLAQWVAAQATITTTTSADNKGNLKGKQPLIFNGTRSKTDNFWWAFKIYHILNKESNTIKSSFDYAVLAISFIAGLNVNDWAEH